MDAEAPILAADRVRLRFGGVRALADVSFDSCGDVILSGPRRPKRERDITILPGDRNARIALSGVSYDCATEQGCVVLDRTTTSRPRNGVVNGLVRSGRCAERGSVHRLNSCMQRKRWP